MAKKEKGKGEVEEAVAPVTDADKARKKKLILLGAVVGGLLLVAVGTTFLALSLLGGDDEVPAAETAAVEEAAPAKAPAIYEALEPPFLANYSVQGRPRYLQVSMALMSREQAAIDAAKLHMPLIRNRIVMLLGGEDFSQLQSAPGREQLQEKVLAAVQEILQAEIGRPGVEQVFFTSLVMQ
jgi:flagellar FliL protein